MTWPDPETLWLVVGALGVTVTWAFTLLWRQARGIPGLSRVALGHGLIGVSGMIAAGAERIPYFLCFTAGNALGVLGVGLLVDGVRLLHGLPARRRLTVALFAIVAVALSLFGYARQEQSPAVLSMAVAGPNAILGALFADAAFTVLRRGRRPGEAVSAVLAAGGFAVVGAGRLAVAGLALAGVGVAEYWKGRGGGDPFLGATLLASIVAATGWTFGLFAIVNRRLLVSSLRQAEYRASLSEVALVVMNRLQLTPLLEALVSRGAGLLEAERGFLYLETPDGTALRSRVWVGDRPVDELVAADEGAVGRAWSRCEPVVVADYDSWPGRSPRVPPGMFGSMLAVPLRAAGKAVGSLGVARARPGRRFDADQVALLLGFSDLASLALDNSLLFEREREARDQAERLQAATRALTGSLDPSTVFDSILRELERVVPADAVVIQRQAGARLESVAARGYAALFLGRSLDAESGDRRHARVLEGREPVILLDAPDLPDGPHAEHASGLHSWLGVPLLFGGQAIGVLALAKREHSFYTPAHARLASAYADQAAVAIENARLYQEARREIEERKRAQADLERSELRYRDLFDHSLGLVCTHDLAGALLSVNAAAARSLGFDPSELVGRDLRERLPERQRARFGGYLEEIQRVGEATGVMTVLSSTGDRRAWRYRNVLRRAPGEAPYVIGFAQDITEEFRSHRALQESEQRFRQVADNLDAVLFVRQVDPPAILYVSPAYARIFGKDPGSLSPEAGVLFADVLPEDRPAVIAAFGTDGPEQGTFDQVYRIVRPDGALRWVRTRTFPGLRRPDGRVERVVGICEDITPLKQAEELRDDLVRTIVHDLRGPLTGIVARLDLLRSGEAGSHPDVVRMAAQSADRLQRLVDAILDIDRVEHGALALQRSEVELPAAVAEACALIAGTAEEKGLSLEQVVDVTLPRAWADSELLLRVLTNLIENAVKFTPRGGRIVVSAELAPEGMLRVRVRDSGPGIPEDLAPRLFQKFVTGRAKGVGSGLGLAFCRLVVEAHGGRIGIETGPTPGAALAFTLPIAGGGLPAA